MVLRIADGKILQDNDLDAMIAGSGFIGILSGLAATPAGSPDDTVTIASGTIRATNNTEVVKSSPTVVPIATSDPTNPRKDIIVINTSGVIAAITGTPSPVTGTPPYLPAPPDIPSGNVLLAEVYVAAGGGAPVITGAEITDKRVFIRLQSDELVHKTQALISSSFTGNSGTGVVSWTAGTVVYAGSSYTLSSGNSGVDWKNKFIVATLSGGTATLSAIATTAKVVDQTQVVLGFVDPTTAAVQLNISGPAAAGEAEFALLLAVGL